MPVLTNDLVVINDLSACKPIVTPVLNQSAPTDLPEQANQLPAAPRVMPAIAYTDQPPFPMSHARILYNTVTAGASVVATAGDNPAFALTPNTWERWEFSGTQSLTITLASSQSIDALGIGSVVAIGSPVLIEYSATLAGSFLPFTASQTNSQSAMLFLRSAPVTVRRIRITVTGAVPGYIGVIYAGIALQMQHPIYSGVNPLVLNRVTDYFNSRTESGQWIGRSIRRRGLESTLSFSRLTAPWYRQYFDLFVQAARVGPFFFAWRPNEYPADVAYCWTDSDIQVSNSGTLNHMAVSFSVKAHS